jgi:hypothetical protein
MRVPLAPLLSIVLLAACGGRDPGEVRTGAAPDAGTTLPPADRVCDMRFAGILLTVRTAAGAPVNDAQVVVRRAADGEVVRTLAGAIDGRGGYVVLDDALPGPVTPGVAFDISVTRGVQTATARLVAGADESGCHAIRLDGPAEVVIR